MQHIHPTAIVSPDAKLGNQVRVGPYAVIEGDVEIGEGSVIGAHSVIHSRTRIGTYNRIHAHVILGDTPQHTAFKPETVSWLIIGDRNEIRELVTMHRAFHDGQATRVGSDGLYMASAHIGHDCMVGDHVIVTSDTSLGGHVEVGDYAVIGGLVGVHQFVRIGAYSMTAAAIMLRKDVLPYSMIGGTPARHHRLNGIGLRRNGVTGDRYRALEQAYRALRNGRELPPASTPETEYLQQWLNAPSKRGLSGFLKSTRSLDE